MRLLTYNLTASGHRAKMCSFQQKLLKFQIRMPNVILVQLWQLDKNRFLLCLNKGMLEGSRRCARLGRPYYREGLILIAAHINIKLVYINQYELIINK